MASETAYWKQDVRILVAMKRFQKEIAKIRAAHGVPANGLPRNKRAEWMESHSTGLEYTHAVYGKRSDFELLPQDPRFIQDLQTLAAKFNLGTPWLVSLFMYLISNEELSPPYSPKATLHPSFNDVRLPINKQKITRLMIEIRKDTSQADVIGLWPAIVEYQKIMDGKPTCRRKEVSEKVVKKYEKISRLEKTFSLDEVAKKVKLDTAKDVSDFKRDVEKRFRPSKPGF